MVSSTIFPKVQWSGTERERSREAVPLPFSTPERSVEFRQPELTPCPGGASQVPGHTLLQSQVLLFHRSLGACSQHLLPAYFPHHPLQAVSPAWEVLGSERAEDKCPSHRPERPGTAVLFVCRAIEIHTCLQPALGL